MLKPTSLRVLFFAFSRSSLGHVVRSSVAAGRLAAAGHEVILACHESARSVPERHGVPWIAMGEIAPAPAWRGLDDPETLRAFVRERLAGTEYVSASLEDELRIIGEHRPDVVVADMRNTAGVAAAMVGVPSCTIHNLRLFQHPMHVVLPEVLRTLAELGVEDRFARKALGDTLLVPDVAVLDRLCEVPSDTAALICSLVDEIRHVGPIVSPELACAPDSDDRLRHTQPGDVRPARVSIMLGGSGAGDHEIDRLVRALAPLGAHLDVVLGNREQGSVGADQARLAALAAAGQVTVSGFRDDVVDVLRRSDVAIVHGGHSSMIEGLVCGTPLVFVPHSTEQRQNAARVQELGLGRVLASDGSDDAVRSAVLDALALRNSGAPARFAAALRRAARGPELVTAIAQTAQLRLTAAPVPNAHGGVSA